MLIFLIVHESNLKSHPSTLRSLDSESASLLVLLPLLFLLELEKAGLTTFDIFFGCFFFFSGVRKEKKRGEFGKEEKSVHSLADPNAGES